MDGHSADPLAAFASVARGERERARWRTADGWVRAQRTSDMTLKLVGPADQLAALCAASRRQWRPAFGHAAPLANSGRNAELVLVRAGERQPDADAIVVYRRREPGA